MGRVSSKYVNTGEEGETHVATSRLLKKTDIMKFVCGFSPNKLNGNPALQPTPKM